MARLTLLDGTEVLVDEEDYEDLSRHRWTRIRKSSSPPVRREGPRGAQKLIWMHREILGLPRGREEDDSERTPKRRVRFVNENPLDCRRENLLVVSAAQTRQSAPPAKRRPDSSQYVGVYGRKGRASWYARIMVAGKSLYLGSFSTEEEAAKSYDAAALEHYGPEARVNFPG